MKEEQLKELFKQQYSANIWQPILKHIFASVDFFVKPVNLEPSEERVTAITQSGSILLEDGKRVGIFEVKVADKTQTDKTIDIQSNRQGLRDIAAQYIDQYATHAVLVFFYADDQPNYRLSLVAKWSNTDQEGYIVRNETNKRRYTYILGKHQNGTTAAKRLAELAELKYKQAVKLPHLIDTFSVEPLNKEFFAKYKEQYALFTEHLRLHPDFRPLLIDSSKPDNEAQEKPLRDFVKKLLGRIVFLHFLQKKGWLGCSPNSWDDGDRAYLQTLFAQTNNKDTFYSTILTTLFFDTLNRERDGDLCYLTTKPSRVPYLNGGLFEKTDSEKKTAQINFPARLFQSLLNFFAQYNFTIDENSPEEQEVGIDPEMLGHIFENLLEDNKDKGAFYTPKEVVQYMCRESLIQYLSQKMPDAKDDIADLINQQNSSILLRKPNNATALYEYLRNVKICDPAIGSGAFPIGLLQEIYQAQRTVFSILPKNKALNFITTDIKRDIIQNAIYGVDLENGAVDIARLRFWLALVVDAEKPEPLPNLDYKIMQGNSLLEYFAGLDLSGIATENDNIIIKDIKQQQISLSDIFNGDSQVSVFDRVTKEELFTLLKNYFLPIQKGDSLNKPQIKQKINDIINGKIQAFMHSEKLRLEKLIKQAQQDFANNKKVNKTSTIYKKYETNKALYDNINQYQETLLDLQKADERPFFLWHTWFKDVFEKNKGFDIIIGNPPYVQLQKGGGYLAELYQNQDFQTFERTGDIYSLFYEKGVQLLAPKGILAFITSNKWMRTNYGETTRKFFAETTIPLLLVDFGNVQVFESATVDTNILFLQKPENPKIITRNPMRAIRLDAKTFNIKTDDLSLHIQENAYNMGNLNHNAWIIGGGDSFNIKQGIEEQGTQLIKWDLVINRGILTGYNEAFIIPEDIKNKLINEDPKSAELLRPILRGKDIQAWYPQYANLWIITTFPSLKIDIDKYPAIKNYLLSIGQARLAQDGKGRKKTGNKWFETQDQINYYQDFDKPKIIYPNMTKYMPFIYDEQGYYSNQKCFIATGKHLKYLTCFFNSKLFRYCFSDNFPELQGGTRELSKVFFNQIPVKPISDQDELPFARIVEYLTALKQNDIADIADKMLPIYFEQIANGLIYEHYFQSQFADLHIALHQHLRDLPPLDKSAHILPQLRPIYQQLYNPKHPVRIATYAMSSIPQIHLIQQGTAW